MNAVRVWQDTIKRLEDLEPPRALSAGLRFPETDHFCGA
jgi:hypothetical protein